MEQFIATLTDLVHHLGYIGIFIATMVESTFVPIPAEVTMLPAGVLAAKGEMSYTLILFASTAGVVVGSLINYWLGLTFGRELIVRYGKYMLLNASFLDKVEVFFKKHGGFATFSGRLIPGVRHYIAFPAGMAKMALKPFIIYTAVGGAIWMWILLHLGYMAGIEAGDGPVTIESIEQILLILVALLAGLFAIKIKFFK